MCYDGSLQNGTCQDEYFWDTESAKCRLCSDCSNYVSKCGPTTDSVCTTTNQVALIASVVCVAVFLLFLCAAFRWFWLQKQTGASRRLIEGNCCIDTPADQGDLPWELRGKYQAVKYIGRGAFGMVIEAKSKQEPRQEYAIKLIFPSDACFSKQDLKRLDREVVCCEPIYSREI